MKPAVVGVLSLQGSVKEHLDALSRLEGVVPLPVKTLSALEQVDGLILPGGESTTLSSLLTTFGLAGPLKGRIQSGMPVWGTCAGLILLAKEIEGEESHLGVMDISVRRNAYGRQADSFCSEAIVPAFGADALPLVFIRAPWIGRVWGETEVLLEQDGHIAAAQERNMLATSFHPELTANLSVHRYFADLCRRKWE